MGNEWYIVGAVGLVALFAVLSMTGLPDLGSITGFASYWPDGQNFPDDFAPPVDPTTGEQYLNVTVTDGASGPTMLIEAGATNKFLNYRGYYLTPQNTWRAFWFWNPNTEGRWKKGERTKTIVNGSGSNPHNIPEEGVVLIFACESYGVGEPYICGPKDVNQEPDEKYWTLHWYNLSGSGSCTDVCTNEGDNTCTSGDLYKCISGCNVLQQMCPNGCNTVGDACEGASTLQNLKLVDLYITQNSQTPIDPAISGVNLTVSVCREVDTAVSGSVTYEATIHEYSSKPTITDTLDSSYPVCPSVKEIYFPGLDKAILADKDVTVEAQFPSQHNALSEDDNITKKITVNGGTCSPPDSYCSGDQIVECDSGTGEWGTPHNCPVANEVCTTDPQSGNGICTGANPPTCPHGSCSGSQSKCDVNGKLQTCQNGCWSAPANCPGSKTCILGACYTGHCDADPVKFCEVAGSTVSNAHKVSGNWFCLWNHISPHDCFECNPGYHIDGSACVPDAPPSYTCTHTAGQFCASTQPANSQTATGTCQTGACYKCNSGCTPTGNSCNCPPPNPDASQSVCEAASDVWIDPWKGDSSSGKCCGDDANEYFTEYSLGSSQAGCCKDDNDCYSDVSGCVKSGYVIPNNNLICVSGAWASCVGNLCKEKTGFPAPLNTVCWDKKDNDGDGKFDLVGGSALGDAEGADCTWIWNGDIEAPTTATVGQNFNVWCRSPYGWQPAGQVGAIATPGGANFEEIEMGKFDSSKTPGANYKSTFKCLSPGQLTVQCTKRDTSVAIQAPSNPQLTATVQCQS